MTAPQTSASPAPAPAELSKAALLRALRRFRAGDFSDDLPDHLDGIDGKICEAFNELLDDARAREADVERFSAALRGEGRMGERLPCHRSPGAWGRSVDRLNDGLDLLTGHLASMEEIVVAVSRGDLSRTFGIEDAPIDLRGDFLRQAKAVDVMVARLDRFASEVSTVAREVGTEGKLGARAFVPGARGTWKDLTAAVNDMSSNLAAQVREIARVTTATAQGELTETVEVEASGEILALKNTINAMVGQLRAFSAEVTRVAREVGTEGVLGGQARVAGASGVWKELTDNVNSMANNLTGQVRNIAEVSKAIAAGDLSKKITAEVRGEMLELKNTINTMVDQLSSFAAEVTRVVRLVGTEGTLGVRADVREVSGIWAELTGNVNSMADNLTAQVRNIATVTTAVAHGDLSQKITVEVKGEILQLKNTINAMVDSLGSFADEVTRMAREVGTEGVLGGQAQVRDVSGIWKELTDNVNSMASNLTDQVRSIADVAAAIAEGDLRKKIQVDARGEILELKNTINTMVDQLSSFAEEVTRVAREVGTEGKLGGQASVDGVRGTWKELTDNVNSMAGNLTAQVRDISQVATAIAGGDLGRKITVEVRGELLGLKETINTMVDQLSSFADEVTRVARDVGVEGVLGGQADVKGVSGIWKELTDNVNLMASNLTNQVRDIARVTTAVATGDLSKKITVEVHGEILQLKNTINTMVDQLSSFADEVTRVSREVGTSGILGGQAEVRGVSGTWRELTDNVNTMARNLTQQVRGIARVVTAVANGDLKQELRLDASGEIQTLVHTINNMIVTLSTFADQVSGVARDVGVEGRLGGQADVPGAAGIWRDLTNNVNELAGNLTRQVRAIGDVATAVTKGDLTRTIDVDAQGEVAILKDNINQMIRTLAETTRVNQEQDWLKTNLTHFTRMLQGQRDLLTVTEQVLTELSRVMGAHNAAFYMARPAKGDRRLELFSTYGRDSAGSAAQTYQFGESLVGQVARDGRRLLLRDVPRDYLRITSSLGSAAPANVVIAPVVFEGEVRGVIELGALHEFTGIQLAFLDQLIDSLGIVVATIEATMRTDELLRQSQTMAEELQKQQEELRHTNAELHEKARQLTAQKEEVERKNREVELAKQEVEEKAEQLAITSKYKSDFLANMSHELRTPLNSLLILSRQLSENPHGNLRDEDVQYARTIYGAGADLLALIDEILDLAKIESGTMTIEVTDVDFRDLHEYVDRSFSQLARERGLSFSVELGSELPTSIATDERRLHQVLRNLISNALKFTEQGSVTVCIEPRPSSGSGVTPDGIEFRVKDTGIGIPSEAHEIIFEAFQQSDGSTSRRYGGTGLGLSISREIASLLGGTLTVESAPGVGSTFTLFVPHWGDLPLPRTKAARESTSSPAAAEASAIPQTVRVDQSSTIDVDSQVVLLVSAERSAYERLSAGASSCGLHFVHASGPLSAIEYLTDLDVSAVIVDFRLRGRAALQILDWLEHSPAVYHVPVWLTGVGAVPDLGSRSVVGSVDVTSRARAEAALETVRARLVETAPRILVVSDDPAVARMVGEGLPARGVEVAATGRNPAEVLRAKPGTMDCIVVDLETTVAPGIAVLQALEPFPGTKRVVVYGGGDRWGPETTAEIERLSSRLRVDVAKAPAELLATIAVRTRYPLAGLPDGARSAARDLIVADPKLRGRKVLIVDDDVRNVFAVTALLERYGLVVVHAENGREALETLAAHTDVEVVLMDIMMPEMDGYEATRRIRAMDGPQQDLPVIALTAKAMRGDREKCLDAGATDSVTKPVEPQWLISVIRVSLLTRTFAAPAPDPR